MNVLQLNKYVTLNGGSEAVMKAVSLLMRSKGHRVIDAGFHRDGQPAVSGSIVDLGRERLSVPGMFTNRHLVKRITALIRKENIDLVLCHNVYHHFPLSQLFREIKRVRDVRLVHFLHDYKIICPSYRLFDGSELCERCCGGRFLRSTSARCKSGSLLQSFILGVDSMYHNKLRNAYGRCDLIIAPSGFLAQKAAQCGFSHPVKVMCNPIVDQESHRDNATTPGARLKNRRLLYAGRLSKEKGIRLLFTLAAELTHLDVEIVGDGPLKQEVLAFARGRDNVHLHGYLAQEELRRMMDRSTFLILPSIWYENNPMIVLESMKQRLPVIGSDLGGVPELLAEGRGILLPVRDPAACVRIVAAAFEIGNHEYEGLQARGAGFADEHSTDAYYDTLMEALRNPRKD